MVRQCNCTSEVVLAPLTSTARSRVPVKIFFDQRFFSVVRLCVEMKHKIYFNRYIRDSSGSILRKFHDTEVWPSAFCYQCAANMKVFFSFIFGEIRLV